MYKCSAGRTRTYNPFRYRVALVWVKSIRCPSAQRLVWSLLVVFFGKTGTNKLPALLERISCRDFLFKKAGNNLRRNLGRLYFFRKIGTIKLPRAIGTIRLPERQIIGSSYSTEVEYVSHNSLSDV